ncbi:DMT family transporter [Treponema sp. HNW]|uniref:DMT family transporter n=1 Tax=Treponema sp. HNW TaxID=3116654 RepID=UPI003D09E910
MQYRTSQRTIVGYLCLAFSIISWGCTFISTKILLQAFNPIEILFIRFFAAYLGLWLLAPRPLKLDTLDGKPSRIRQELYFAGAGFFAVTLYQFLENIALTYSQASNVSLIASTAPVFTAIAIKLCLKNSPQAKPLTLRFILGFLCAMAGIALISFSGATELHLNPIGDFLAFVGAVVWAGYSVLIVKVNDLNLPALESTRRMFFYALITLVPAALISGIETDIAVNVQRFSNPVYIGHFLFLGIGASALTYSAWALAGKYLGIVKTSLFIYVIPVITVIAAAVFLNERFTLMSALGTLLTILGLFVSG